MLIQYATPQLREKLADAQHMIWSHWMLYLFSVCPVNDDGSWTIPADKAERWLRQMKTDYADLTELEKNSDRRQADKVIAKASEPGIVLC